MVVHPPLNIHRDRPMSFPSVKLIFPLLSALLHIKFALLIIIGSLCLSSLLWPAPGQGGHWGCIPPSPQSWFAKWSSKLHNFYHTVVIFFISAIFVVCNLLPVYLLLLLLQQDLGDGFIETRLYMKQVMRSSFRVYSLLAENSIGTLRHNIPLAQRNDLLT